ncbi:MAG: 2-oxoacid:acceptor oxidoreductase family protein [Spirochaetaceae bacterium]|nr:2-oxoacid:acceptor oxidoreductase family protein [Spirochaetaceae bacterium]
MTKIIFSGFGGQGVLTLGQIVATIAMNKGKEVTWMPSYGPEMRGGTANCSVIIADKVIGSPIVASGIDILVAMNGPSIDKFLPKVKKGGLVFVNSSVISQKIARDDVTVVAIDATNIASHLGNLKVQNMVMLAAFLKAGTLFTIDDIGQVLEQKFGAKYPKLIPLNMEAVKKGLE